MNIRVTNTLNGTPSGTETEHRRLTSAAREALRRLRGIGDGWGVRIFAPAAMLDTGDGGPMLPRDVLAAFSRADQERLSSMVHAR